MESRTCSVVTDSVVMSPTGRRAHLLNQGCTGGLGVGGDVFWVAIGDKFEAVGRQDRVDQLAPELSVVFKTLRFKPRISWADENTLVIKVAGATPIQKSLHALDGISIRYEISKELASGQYLDQLKQTEPSWLRRSYLEEYEAFESWAKGNVERSID